MVRRRAAGWVIGLLVGGCAEPTAELRVVGPSPVGADVLAGTGEAGEARTRGGALEVVGVEGGLAGARVCLLNRIEGTLERCTETDEDGWTREPIRSHDADEVLVVSAAQHCAVRVGAFEQRAGLVACATRRVAGRVVDDGGVGIARAQLRLNEEDQAVAWAISDGSGRFEFEVDVAAVVSVEAVAPGYGRAWTPSLAPNHALEVRMPPASTIAGVVVDEGGAAIAGALVETEIGLEAILAGRFAPERDWTDSNGRFEITGLAPGDYRLRADGRLGRSDRVDLSLGLAEARTDLRLVARTGNLLQVTLHDHHDQPCRAGQVRLGASGRAGVTEGGGRWVFADVGRGRYDLVAHCEGSALLRESVWVEGDTELALRSPRGAAVSGTVRRSDGTPVRAYVHAVGTDNHVGVRSDADGRFTLTGLVAERVRLDVSALGVLVERRAEFDLVANEDRRDVELIAATGECVTGRLDGPAPDSVVIAARVGDRTVDVATADSEGRFRLCGIGLGETVVVELASGGGACRVEKTQPGPGRGDEGGWICEP